MNKFLFAAVVSLVVSCLASGGTGTVVLKENFDGDISKWEGLGFGWNVEPGVGTGGSKAIVWRTPAKGVKPQLARCWLTGYRPGMKVEVTCRARVLEAGKKPPPAHICDMEWWDLNNKWAGGGGVGHEVVFNDFPVDGDGWSIIRYTIPWLRSDASKSVFEFFPIRPESGVLAIDDVLVRVVERKMLPRASTSAYRGKSREGRVSFAAALGFDPRETPLESLRCTFSFNDPSGALKSVAADEINYRWARVKLNTSAFAIGRNDVLVTLSGADGKLLEKRTIPFERLAPDAEMPRVYLDGCGRAVIEGKRFFPLGMFWHDKDFKKRPEVFDRYVNGPFNCLQTYDQGVTPEMLDAYWKKGLYVMPTVQGGYYLLGSMKKRAFNLHKGIETEEEARVMLTDYVNGIKNHPAVFAWYTSDEFFPWMAPLYEERAELLRTIDPSRPHYAVGNMVDYVPALMKGFDVFGPDLYCIRTRGQREEFLLPDRGTVWKCVELTEKMIDACGGILHIWPVPQAFARGWDMGRGTENWRKYHFPTALEFRAMCWQYIAIGANGLLHYAYGQMLWALEGEEFEKAWKTVCDASAEVRAQIPVILKDEGPLPRNLPENVRVRTWRDGEADYALICNLRPDPLSGTVDVDFKGVNVEHLTGEGKVTRRDGGFSFELGPFAHGLVKVPFTCGTEKR